VARKLSIATSLNTNENGYMSAVLPEELLVEIISERLQLSDCGRGVVLDGLETLFSQNYFTATMALLKAFNNRRFIYFVTLKSDFQKYKEHLNKISEEKRNIPC
jgi:hydrocephalus-inducing protein